MTDASERALDSDDRGRDGESGLTTDARPAVYAFQRTAHLFARHGEFVVLNDYCWTSARRFLRGGFFRMGIMYLKIFAHRTIHGECQGDMGYWDDQSYDPAPGS